MKMRLLPICKQSLIDEEILVFIIELEGHYNDK